MDTDEESNDAMASNLSEGTEELNGDNDIRMGDNDTTNPGSPSPVPGPQERREVRIPIGINHTLTHAPGPLCDIKRY